MSLKPTNYPIKNILYACTTKSIMIPNRDSINENRQTKLSLSNIAHAT